MNNKYYGSLIFELSKKGRRGYSLPKREYDNQYAMEKLLPQNFFRNNSISLPEVDEPTVVRHYTNMSNNNFGVD